MEVLSGLVFVAVVSGLVEILKLLEQRLLGFNERVKDIVYALLAAIFVALGKVLGIVNIDWSVILPLLFAPQGLFVVIKKLFNR